MKKYIKPTTDIILIETQQMIAESLGKDSSDPINDNGKVLSRRGGHWDYDDEEDEEEEF